MGKDYGFLVIAKTKQGNVLRQVVCLQADRGVPEKVATEVSVPQDNVYLRIAVDEGRVSFSYSLDGNEFRTIGQTLTAQPGVWIGAKMGIFASGETDHGEFGYADFDWFRVTPLP
jgi:beta-xylosidase